MNPSVLRAPSLLALCLVLTSGHAATGDDSTTEWASFRGPGAVGAARAVLPPGDGPVVPKLVWSRELGSGYAGVSVAAGLAVTAAAIDGSDQVVALDPATGEERWRRKLGPTYRGHDGSHDGPIATPAIADGRVFALGASGELVALAVDGGEEIWRVALTDDLGCDAPFYGFASSPVVVGETVVVQICSEGGSVAGFEVATGKLAWRAIEDSAMANSPVVAELDGRTQVVVLGSAKAAGIDPADGTVLWEYEHKGQPGPFGAWTASPLVSAEGRILLKLEDGQTAILDGEPEAGDAEAAENVRASRGMSRSYSPPVAWEGAAYGYTARFLSALDLDSGELLWRSREPGDGFLIVADGLLAVLTKQGSLHLGPARRDGWTETARLDVFDDLAWTPPSIAGSSLYLRSLGAVARVDLVRGAVSAETAAPQLPAALASLGAELEGGADPTAAVDAFLAGKEPPLVDGDQVVFLYRGEGDDVAIAGDMLGMRTEEPMNRLAGTDLWWWETRIDRRARLNYLMLVDDEPTVDPAHDRTTASSVLGSDMNWNRGEDLQMSWFAMPDWPGHQPAGGPVSRIESFELELTPPAREGQEAPPPVALPVHVWLPPGYDDSEERYPVVYVHHPGARAAGDWPATLDRVVGRSVAPLIVVFIEPAQRVRLGPLFVDQVVTPIDERFRTRREREARANVGMGWQGMAATMLTMSAAQEFGRLGVQSFYALDAQMGATRGAVESVDAAATPVEVYLEWGRWDLVSPYEEMNMRASSRQLWELLSERGFAPVGGEVWDSTDWGSWRNRTAVLLEALFPLQPTGQLPVWQTAAAP